MRFVIQGGVYLVAASRWLKPAMLGELRNWKQDWANLKIQLVECGGEKCDARMVDALWKYVHGRRRAEQEVLQTLDEMLFADLDVTTHVLSWTLITLAENKSVQAELRKEIRANSDQLVTYIGGA
ncbi:hypothetical protein MMC17_000380 [Xylographa soralifera]|nr:hypothetical protein [Xylographa soralifera]